MYMKYTINFEDEDIKSLIDSMIKDGVYEYVKKHHPDILSVVKKEIRETLYNTAPDNK